MYDFTRDLNKLYCESYRYWELVGVHGKLDPLVSVDLRPEKRVQITFTCGEISEVRTIDVYRYLYLNLLERKENVLRKVVTYEIFSLR